MHLLKHLNNAIIIIIHYYYISTVTLLHRSLYAYKLHTFIIINIKKHLCCLIIFANIECLFFSRFKEMMVRMENKQGSWYKDVINVICLALGTSCCWQDTKVWKPGATPNPSWSMKGGSSWLWIWTLMPASYEVSSVGRY